MANEAGMTLPPVEVFYRDDNDELLAVRLRTTIKDRSAYEVYAHKHKWPTLEPMRHAPFLWFSFLAWSALRRTASAPSHLKTATPDEFMDLIEDVMPVTDEEEADEINPTQEAAGPASD